ncbi:hypothetical protein BDF19DRAFT_447602 [Syncephalis fuscata]|nr:hypothetical protein BDF19DRAFT_447602 [Syncephalis fuscata]
MGPHFIEDSTTATITIDSQVAGDNSSNNNNNNNSSGNTLATTPINAQVITSKALNQTYTLLPTSKLASNPMTSNGTPVLAKSMAAAPLSTPRQAIKPGVPLLALYIRFVRQTDGRDKTMKLIQYLLKVLLWKALKTPKDALLRERLSALTKAFSTTRKIIRLGHWLEPYDEIVEWLSDMPGRKLTDGQSSKNPPQISTAMLLRWLWGGVPPIVGFMNDLLDDIYCLCRINCLPKWMEDPSEVWSLRFWFTGIWFDLYANAKDQLALQDKIDTQKLMIKRLQQDVTDGDADHRTIQVAEKTLATLYDKQYWLRVSCGKFLGDLGFCTYDMFHWQFSDGWPALTGLLSGMLSAHKLWVKTASA